VTLTEILDELLVAVTLIATQPEVTVDSLDAIIQGQQHPQQSDTVCPTTQRHKQQPLFRQKSVITDEISNPA
jgi:hypothetical protein